MKSKRKPIFLAVDPPRSRRQNPCKKQGPILRKFVRRISLFLALSSRRRLQSERRPPRAPILSNSSHFSPPVTASTVHPTQFLSEKRQTINPTAVPLKLLRCLSCRLGHSMLAVVRQRSLGADAFPQWPQNLACNGLSHCAGWASLILPQNNLVAWLASTHTRPALSSGSFHRCPICTRLFLNQSFCRLLVSLRFHDRRARCEQNNRPLVLFADEGWSALIPKITMGVRWICFLKYRTTSLTC